MTDMMIANLKHDIDAFIRSTEGKEGETGEIVGGKKIKSREKILAAIRDNGHHTTNSLFACTSIRLCMFRVQNGPFCTPKPLHVSYLSGSGAKPCVLM